MTWPSITTSRAPISRNMRYEFVSTGAGYPAQGVLTLLRVGLAPPSVDRPSGDGRMRGTGSRGGAGAGRAVPTSAGLAVWAGAALAVPMSKRTPQSRRASADPAVSRSRRPGSPEASPAASAPASAEAAQPQAVEHHRHRAERHRSPGDHRIQQPGRRQRQRRQVVAERPSQVALDDAQRATAQPDG